MRLEDVRYILLPSLYDYRDIVECDLDVSGGDLYFVLPDEKVLLATNKQLTSGTGKWKFHYQARIDRAVRKWIRRHQ